MPFVLNLHIEAFLIVYHFSFRSELSILCPSAKLISQKVKQEIFPPSRCQCKASVIETNQQQSLLLHSEISAVHALHLTRHDLTWESQWTHSSDYVNHFLMPIPKQPACHWNKSESCHRGMKWCAQTRGVPNWRKYIRKQIHFFLDCCPNLTTVVRVNYISWVRFSIMGRSNTFLFRLTHGSQCTSSLISTLAIWCEAVFIFSDNRQKDANLSVFMKDKWFIINLLTDSLCVVID